MNLEKLTHAVVGIAEKSGAFIRAESENLKTTDIRIKGANNFVTYVDHESEKMLVTELERLLPGSGFIAEENPEHTLKELTWIIDPLDGTTNFIHGIPVYSVSIGLMQGDEIISGVVYEVNLRECFYTWKGSNTFLNGKQVRVSEVSRVADSIFATGFPYYDYKWLDEYLELFRYLMQFSQGVRRLGSAAADLAWVACGRFEGFYEYGLSPWDVAAGSLLVKNAGGTVTDFRGGSDFIFGKEIFSSNSLIHKEFLTHFTRWKSGQTL